MSAVYQPSRSLAAKLTRRITQWRAAKPAWAAAGQPTLSITFDDFPESAASVGAAILERHGVRGTFYACGGFHDQPTPFGPGFRRAQLDALAAAGHEVGCHTFSHLDCAQAPAQAVAAECAKNADALAALGVERCGSFAFPYGEATFAAKRALAQTFETGRGILPGVNLGRVDAMQLRSVPLFGEAADSHCAPWLGLTARSGGWLIVFTHDVAAAPSPWGVTPDALERLVGAAKSAGFAIETVADAARRRLKALAA